MGAMNMLAQKPCAIDTHKFSVLSSEIRAVEVARKDLILGKVEHDESAT
jgi:hypothetical protein